ncbi:GIY-YIG catalytic domain-containing protein [Pseudobutyrivibrio sp. ACV-2]|uniref:GIY-YIG nuclease family protein n=1 Tax=Pseudobutyrivibrio sp. ACV-2 TaxID=1520801 RepID=UPI00089A95B8|nr:GIY-YIG nuclease family protein [Pseudobutyrivibrio sp. ACV-2]SEA88804.1 GIY-YIG catalytic domain-containing protein [Pseudobutyrivibrio sp. ACV-2]
MSRYLDYYFMTYKENYKDYKLPLKRYYYDDLLSENFYGTFKEICERVKGSEDRGYFRFAGLSQNTIKGSEKYDFFNVHGRAKGGCYFDLDELMNRYLNKVMDVYMYGNPLIYRIDPYNFYHFIFTYAYQTAFINRLLSNDAAEFDNAIDKLQIKYKKIQKISNLDEVKGKKGIYILILKKYKVCYVGQTTNDFRRRIMEHWSADRAFDIQGIDTFKVGDTSDILIYECPVSKLNDMEQKIIASLPAQFTLNWVKGGEFTIQKETLFPFKEGGMEDILINDIKTAAGLLSYAEKKFGASI